MGMPPAAPILARQTSQIITPITDRKSKLFFNFGPWMPLAEKKHQFFPIAEKAFLEDKIFIEAQQAMMDRLPDRKVMPLSMDVPLTRYMTIYNRLLEEEQQFRAA